jgi:hypothetical protein
MNSDQHYGGGVPLPGPGEPAAPPGPAASREAGLRHVRRMSAWSAAALIVGTGAATAALAHGFTPATQQAATTPATTAPATTTGAGTAATPASGGPAVSHSVASTSGSGVTKTVTRTVNGKAVVTQVRVPYHDN